MGRMGNATAETEVDGEEAIFIPLFIALLGLFNRIRFVAFAAASSDFDILEFAFVVLLFVLPANTERVLRETEAEDDAEDKAADNLVLSSLARFLFVRLDVDVDEEACVAISESDMDEMRRAAAAEEFVAAEREDGGAGKEDKEGKEERETKASGLIDGTRELLCGLAVSDVPFDEEDVDVAVVVVVVVVASPCNCLHLEQSHKPRQAGQAQFLQGNPHNTHIEIQLKPTNPNSNA